MSITYLFLPKLIFPLLYGTVARPTWGTGDVRDRKAGPPIRMKPSCGDKLSLLLFLSSTQATKSMFRWQGAVKLRWDM